MTQQQYTIGAYCLLAVLLGWIWYSAYGHVGKYQKKVYTWTVYKA